MSGESTVNDTHLSTTVTSSATGLGTASGGEMGELTRAFDWSSTSLGPIENWPQSLKTITSVLLTSRHPMFLWWGDELIQIYNDGYRPSLGEDRHPAALGARGREFWGDIWPVIGPEVESVMRGGEASWHEDNLVPISRNGRMEEVYWTYSYSPVLGDDDRVGGTLVTVQETTRRVLTERRMMMLRMLAERTAAEARTVNEVALLAADVFAQNDGDIAFALLYLLDEDGSRLRLASSVGDIPAHICHDIVPLNDLTVDDPGWPIADVVRTGNAAMIDDLERRFGSFPGRRWPEPVEAARIIPILHASDEHLHGVLVIGLSPRLPVDENYCSVLDIAASQIATAISNARSHEAQKAAVKAVEFERTRLRDLFEHSPAVIALVQGPDHVFELANPRYLEIIGRSDIFGKSIREAFPELDGQGFFEMLDDVYASGKVVVGTEVPVHWDRNTDGELENAFFNFGYQRFGGDENTPHSILMHAVEVTDEVIARQEVEATVAARDEFLSIAAHELRTPLTNIKGMAQLLQRNADRGTLDSGRLQRHLASIVTQTDRLSGLVVDLLDISRLRGGQLALRPREFDFVQLVQETISSHGDELEDNAHIVTINTTDDSLTMIGDPDRLEQILSNLLDNAAKYSSSGSEIIVAVTGDVNNVYVSVQDKGIGLTAGMAERIFEPFGRAPNAAALDIPGIGLGLYISRQIAHRHNGSLWAESAGEGRGTTMRMTVPRWGELNAD